MSRPRAPRIAGKLFRAILLAIVFGVTGLAVWRACYSAGEPKTIRVMTSNEVLAEAYRAADGDLNCYRQEQATITRAKENYGYFSVTRCVFIPEAKQVQLVFRYNNSTLRHLAEDKNLREVPAKAGTYFDVTLVKSADLTPDDPTDNLDPSTLALTRYAASGEPVRAQTALYTYFRYTFDGVDVDDLTVGVFADVYYLGDLSTDETTGGFVYPETPYGVLCLWDNESENLPYALTKADRKAIEGK